MPEGRGSHCRIRSHAAEIAVSGLDGLKLLRTIEEGVAGKYGEAFFKQIVQDLSGALNAHAAFAGRLNEDRTGGMMAFLGKGFFRAVLDLSPETDTLRIRVPRRDHRVRARYGQHLPNGSRVVCAAWREQLSRHSDQRRDWRAVVGHLVQRQRNTTAAKPVVERTQDIKP